MHAPLPLFDTWVTSPLGPLHLVADADGLVGLYFAAHRGAPSLVATPSPEHPHLQATAAQLREFFAGTRTQFDLTLNPHGTPFQLGVWAALREIPFGTTATYADLAARLGRPTATRAVGAANGDNPLAIVVPCHRVVGTRGLTGYAGGLPAKSWLLSHEATHATGAGPLFASRAASPTAAP
ncbi:MAG: methylated-DNA--[protein]-cysteine S-methyltransferase [Kofleriaceae bacterium]